MAKIQIIISSTILVRVIFLMNSSKQCQVDFHFRVSKLEKKTYKINKNE